MTIIPFIPKTLIRSQLLAAVIFSRISSKAQFENSLRDTQVQTFSMRRSLKYISIHIISAFEGRNANCHYQLNQASNILISIIDSNVCLTHQQVQITQLRFHVDIADY